MSRSKKLPAKTYISICRLHLKCDGTHAEIRFRLLAKRTSPFKSAEASVQSTTGSRAVRISGSNAGYTTYRGCVNSTRYPLHLPVSPSLPPSCVTVCRHISIGLYCLIIWHVSGPTGAGLQELYRKYKSIFFDYFPSCRLKNTSAPRKVHTHFSTYQQVRYYTVLCCFP
jgi:hypothetical protein